jgi:hypothetical protein
MNPRKKIIKGTAYERDAFAAGVYRSRCVDEFGALTDYAYFIIATVATVMPAARPLELGFLNERGIVAFTPERTNVVFRGYDAEAS